MLRLFKIALLTLFPEHCLGCGKEDTALCAGCETRLTPATPPDHKDALAVFSYKDPVIRAAIQKLKYRNRATLAETLARLMAPHLLEALAELSPFTSFERPLLVAVPLSKGRKKKRGYNHAHLLAKGVALETHFEYLGDVVRKIRETQSQVSMKNRRERLENLRGAFRAPQENVAGRNCIIVDDVTTTGATLTEMRAALKEAGAKNIFAITLAH